MLNYKELQQLLQPLNVEQTRKSKQAARNQEFSLNLEHRELRKIPPLIPFKEYAITQLSLSFNFLKDLKSLRDLSSQHLTYLNLSFNFLTSIEKLGNSFPSLKVIDANANRIVSLELNDAEFPVLEALYLKSNKIQYFLHCPNSVEILCLDHNEMARLAFTGGRSLEILSASHNKIQEIELERIEKLNFLDLQENKISDMEKLKKLLAKGQNLLSLNLINNYVSKISHKNYLVQMLVNCPKLIKIDEVMINPHVRQAFKIIAEEDKMADKMKETEQKYMHRMQEQLKIKEQMIDKLKQDQAAIEKQFEDFLMQEKEQMDVLQNYAKNNMGKKVMGVVEENKGFNGLVNEYNSKETGSAPSDRSGSSMEPGFGNFEIGNELNMRMVQGVIISQHKDEYREYKANKEKQGKGEKRSSKIKKYLGLEKKKAETQSDIAEDEEDDNDDDSDGFNESMSDDDDELSPAEKQRRKKNMRNPGLVYRNSNELIGVSATLIEDDVSSDEEYAFHKKCLPYLVKNYGFHTVV